MEPPPPPLASALAQNVAVAVAKAHSAKKLCFSPRREGRSMHGALGESHIVFEIVTLAFGGSNNLS